MLKTSIRAVHVDINLQDRIFLIFFFELPFVLPDGGILASDVSNIVHISSTLFYFF